MRVRILGKSWNLVRGKLPADTLGWCDEPSSPKKTIVIRPSLRGERELDTILHELLHAADWHKDEQWVDTVASDVARILWRLGYRKSEP